MLTSGTFQDTAAGWHFSMATVPEFERSGVQVLGRIEKLHSHEPVLHIIHLNLFTMCIEFAKQGSLPALSSTTCKH